ncbi:MAG: putative bifunctional diguanylate cyclase/phosphodiesterase [Acidimicrobiales bacterium]
MARPDRRADVALPFPEESDEVLDLTAGAMLAHVSDLVAVVAPDGTLRAVSPSIEQRLGHRAGSLVGAPVSSLFVADPADVPAEVLDRVFSVPGPHGPLVLQAMTADGRSRTVEAIIDNRLDVEGIGAVVVTAVDLTERHMFEASLAEQRSLLEVIARGASLNSIADRITERVETWLPDAVSAVLFCDEGSRWRVASAPTMPDALSAVFAIPDRGVGVSRPLASLPFAVTAVDVADPFWFSMRAACRATGIEMLWIRPFAQLGSDVPSGAIVVARTDRRHLDDSEVDLVEQSAHLAAIAVERWATTAALEHQALHDDLTGLPNRILLADRIEQALGRVDRVRSQVAVLFVDLDRFKHINDSLGHATGDGVLTEIGARLQSVLRVGDTVGRLGGDEFLMVCTDVGGPVDAMAIAQRAVDVLRDPVASAGNEVIVRASIGVALADRADITADEIIRNADHAMYRAKERGRDAIAMFDQADHERVMTRVDIERSLHGAHERGELLLHFQPVFRLPDRRQESVEALVRWERPGSGVVYPRDFIGVAEDSGLIVPLGGWVIEEAFRSAAAWPEVSPGTAMKVAVNLSPRQLSAPGLLDRINRMFDRTGLDPSTLCFEVTESALVRDEELAIATLNRLKSLGVRIAIDDFGTGYATLDYLRRFTMADVLKIDQSFVAGLGDPLSQEHAIVAASVTLAHSLGIEVIAEGIEDEHQLAAAIELGCDQAQGYLLGMPEHFVAAVATSLTTGGRGRPGS